MNRPSSSNKRLGYGDHDFVDTVFSWSLEDIFSEDLYKQKVDKIDLSFESVDHYFRSFVYPLLEESRAKLCSSMEILSTSPFAEVISLQKAKSYDERLYYVKTDTWKNRFSGHGKEPYKALFGDVFILADFKPETVTDLQRAGRMWTFVLSAGILEEKIEDGDAKLMYTFKVISFKDIDINEVDQKSLYIIFLRNIIPEKRIWDALHMQRDSKLIERILCARNVVEGSCNYCSPESDALRDDIIYQKLTSELNESQYKAISACLSSIHCNHKSTVDLIWGPPGTGKTKTLATLHFALLKMNRRTLVCAPTNVAIKEVASRVLSMVRASFDRNSDDLFCSLGDMLLFGNHEQLRVGAEIEDIYLDYRVEQLAMCFTPPTGWRYYFGSMIDLLENCVSHYHIFVENELRKARDQIDENNTSVCNKEKDDSPSDCGATGVRRCKSFLEFVRESFLSIALPLRNCVSILCTHVARSYIMEHNLKDLACLFDSLVSFQALLFESNIACEVLEEIFSSLVEGQHGSFESVMGFEYSLYKSRTECLSLLKTLKVSLGKLNMPYVATEDDRPIREFCLQTSSLIFSTASSSFKLHSVAMEPLDILVIDEAAQLKECESTIPLLLPDINHVILVGDECQLPAMVESSVSSGVGFGRSLFQRLSLLGHPNHFLNIQYRMHPAISSFPNSHFYLNQILDAPNVMRKNYGKQYLPGPMFGPYSFISIVGGSEEFDDAGRSRKNMVEVAVVIKIIKNCFKAWLDLKENFSIGVVSPYAAQVVAIQDMVGQKYDRHEGFNVKVKTIDGFQGGEQDIIILSTVRTDHSTSLKFISDHQRTNVALTRARHCLWILGNEGTLVSQENVWKALVLDAKKRQCFFNADEDSDLAKSIWDAKKELDQFDDLLNADSVLFRKSRWKVLFSDNFRKSFKKLSSKRTKQSVISLLLKLSSGWRPKKIKVDLLCGNSFQMLKQYKVEGLFVVCSKDIVKDLMYTQVLKIWDILQPEDIPKVVKRLDSIFESYTDDFTSRCSAQCFEGKIEVPMSWEKSTEIIKFKSLDNNGNEAESSYCDQRVYVENSKLCHQNNYETATMCFERAGVSYGENKSKAAGLRATANRLRDLNPEDANAILREAAVIFEGIGMADSAAQCFFDLGDYERAGKLYLEKCEEPDLKRAGDCFDLAGYYETAGQVYARGSFFTDCLNVCAKGELFDTGLYYIQHWKQNENDDCSWAKSHDLYKMEQKFLESCARNYFNRKDTISMMKFVRVFHSMDLKREFLQSLSLLDELLELEEESGNFMEAVNIAKMMGDTLHEADLLGKAGKFNEAYELVLCYVLANSLWSSGSKGWPLKQFANKVELLGRALSFAKEISSSFYELASAEAGILSNEYCNSFEIMNHLKSSRMHRSTRGEILCLWKLLEAHFRMDSSKYVRQDNVFDDSMERMIMKNQLSVETLCYCWTCWKDKIVHMLECLPNFKTQEPHQDSNYVKFALNYLGVQKQHLKLNETYTYLLLVPDAYWVMKLGGGFLKKNGRLVCVDEHHLVSFAQSFWRSELLSVGMVVLQNLDAYYSFSVSKAHSEFSQFETLLLIYEVSKFLLKSECFNHHNHGNLKPLEKFYSRPIECFFCYVVPLDCNKSLSKEMVCLRGTETCQDMMKEAIYDSVKRKDRLTHRKIGRLVVMILSTGNLNNELFVEIMTRFAHHKPWREFIQGLQRNSEGDVRSGFIFKFYKALQYTYNVNRRMVADYVSPCCFMYLIDRLLFLTPSFFTGCLFGTKSSFIEWLISQNENSFSNLCFMGNPQDVHNFIADVLGEFVFNQNGTKDWIRKSNLDVESYFPVLLLRLVVLVCLLHLISGQYVELIHDLLEKNYIASQLPVEFRNVLQKGRKCMGLKVIAEAFKVIDNPLIIVRLQHNSSEILCPDAMFMDLTILQREFILQTLFPNIVDDVGVETASATVEASDATSKEFPLGLPNKNNATFSDQAPDGGIKDEINMSTNADDFWEWLENLQLAIDESSLNRVLPNSVIIKKFLDPCIQIFTPYIHNPFNLYSKNERVELVCFHHQMKQLRDALSTSDSVIGNHIGIKISKQILSRRSQLTPILNKPLLQCISNTDVEHEPSQASTAACSDENEQDVVKELKDSSQGGINSGDGNIKKNNKGKRNKSKKNKGGKKGGK